MKVSCSTVQFRIDVDFEGCEVDMVLREMIARGVTSSVPSILCDGGKIEIDRSKLSKTPSESSVYFCLNYLAGFVDRHEMVIQDSKWECDYSKPITAYFDDGSEYTTFEKNVTELEKLGVEVVSFYPLMQGTCHLICEIDHRYYNKELVEHCKNEVNKVFDKYVVYYS